MFDAIVNREHDAANKKRQKNRYYINNLKSVQIGRKAFTVQIRLHQNFIVYIYIYKSYKFIFWQIKSYTI